MATEDLPPGIFVDILSRLGVRDLLRCRCVAKQWRSAIDDPDFISLHLTRSLKSGSNKGLLLEDERLHWVDSLESPDSAADLSRGGGRIVSACNGLVALQFQTPGGVSILNPSTRRSWSVPLSGGFDSPEGWCGRLFLGGYDWSVIGFGYDPVGDDYKLLRFRLPESVAEVYGLRKSTAWKRVEGTEPYWVGFDEGNVSVNDALHWIIITADLSSPKDFRDGIAAFDLVTDEFRKVELPPLNKLGGGSVSGPHPYVRVAKLKDWLCVAARRDGGVQIAVWAMKEYGVVESWAKLFSITPPFGLWYLVPVSYVDGVGGDDHDHDDEVLMMTMGFRKRVVSYAVGTGRFKDVPVSGACSVFCSGCVCVPSLLGWSDFGDPESSDQNYEDEPAEETGDLED